MSDEQDPPSEGNVVPFRPRKQKELEGSGSGRGRRRGKITAVGSEYNGPPMRPGQNVICKIAKAVPGGYEVWVDTFFGYLPTQQRHNIGEELLVTYICMDKGRLLLAERYGKSDTVSYAKKSIETSVHAVDPYGPYMPSPNRTYRNQRAIDLFPIPAVDNEQNTTEATMRLGDLKEFLIDLENGKRTAIMIATNEFLRSRGAALFFKGRVVGCIYGSVNDPITKPTEDSLRLLLDGFQSEHDTKVTMFDAPESLVLSMSSLFLGYPVERSDDYNAKEYLDYICNWLGQKSVTATLAISLTQNRGTCLGYIYEGRFSGAFYVDEQTFRTDRQFIEELLFNDPQAGLEVSILPPECNASAVRFGFSPTSML